MERSARRGNTTADVLAALAGWQVLVGQFNDLVARKLGVTPTETQCLYVLARFGASTPSEIAQHVNLTSGATSRMLDRLHRAGYISRTADPSDRRKVIIEAAGDGIARIEDLYRPLNADLAALLTHVDVEQLTALAEFARAAESATAQRIRQL